MTTFEDVMRLHDKAAAAVLAERERCAKFADDDTIYEAAAEIERLTAELRDMTAAKWFSYGQATDLAAERDALQAKLDALISGKNTT